jgi:2-desacetyl-2-hydroxyethyl bacteriochlorophyllide A dehydrogenase
MTNATLTATATMPAAVLADIGRLALEDRPLPALERPGDVIVEVEACGICGSDLQILSTPPGHPATVGVVLGHEFVGHVAEVGAEVTSVRAGHRVVIAPNVSCGECPWCRRGLRNHCNSFTTHGVFVDGGLAPRVRVPASACHRISRDVPAHVAALAEPLSTVVHGARAADVFPGEVVAVIGAGPVGLMLAAVLKLAGAIVMVVEPAEHRRALAEAMGAAAVVNPGRENAGEVVRGLSDGLGADVVVDAVGSQLPVALSLVRKAGRVVLFGVNSRARARVAQEQLTRDELTLIGTFVGQDVFPPAIRLLEQGAIDFERLVSHRIELDELPAAVEELRRGRAVKVEVVFDSS